MAGRGTKAVPGPVAFSVWEEQRPAQRSQVGRGGLTDTKIITYTCTNVHADKLMLYPDQVNWSQTDGTVN